MDRLAILTYNKPHRKTFDLVTKMIFKGYKPDIIAVDWIDRKNHVPLIKHRPVVNNDVHPKELAEFYKLDYIECNDLSDLYIDDYDCVLIGGARILPQKAIRHNTIINAHPAYLPHVRGLDALKWAIYLGEPIGVTTHIINDEIDSGELIERKLLPLSKYDTFHSISNRQYELEIEMLANSVENIKDGVSEINNKHYTPHKRMPQIKETELFERTKKYLKNY